MRRFWKELARLCADDAKEPPASLKAIQFLIENQFKDKKPVPTPEQFVDTSLVEQLEMSGFIDSVNK